MTTVIIAGGAVLIVVSGVALWAIRQDSKRPYGVRRWR